MKAKLKGHGGAVNCHFSDEEVETLALVLDHALKDSEAMVEQMSRDRIFDGFDDFLPAAADAERTIRDIKRMQEEVTK
jgi:hypothetical protein